VIYPIIGAALVWLAYRGDLLPLLFPSVSGFALVGPAAAVGMYELSRRRERGEPTTGATPRRSARLLLARSSCSA
jgi:uncharacterized membrane protein